MIKTILFDLGGVIYTGNPEEAQRRFKAIGLHDAETRLNPYTQTGIFGDLEDGTISDTQFLNQLSQLCNRPISWDECQDCWLGYCKELPARNLQTLQKLRNYGYRLALASNTNPFVMGWTESKAFDNQGNSINHYFDHLYVSYKLRHLKPNAAFFKAIINNEKLHPTEMLFIDDSLANITAAAALGINTILAKNGEDWTGIILQTLNKK